MDNVGPQGFGIVAAVMLAVVVGVAATAGGDAVVVNGTALSAGELEELARMGSPVSPGRYWYDATSGLWGREGGPARGRVAPGLAFSGPLRPDASGGASGVHLNGRALHPAELAWLVDLVGPLPDGRYWLAANGIGGREGGEPAFDLRSRAARRGARSVFGHGLSSNVLGEGEIAGFVVGAVGAGCELDAGCVYSD